MEDNTTLKNSRNTLNTLEIEKYLYKYDSNDVLDRVMKLINNYKEEK